MGGNFAAISIDVGSMSEHASTTFGVETPGEPRGIRGDEVLDLMMGFKT